MLKKASYATVGQKLGIDDSTLHIAVKKYRRTKIARKNEGYVSPLSEDDWAPYYCGPEYSWSLEYLTTTRQKIIDALKLLIFLARGSGKSQLCISSNARFILETRQPVLIITSGPASANRLFKEFRRILESEKVQNDYGDTIFSSLNESLRTVHLRPDLRLSKDPLLRVVARSGDVIGSHPKRLWIEDIIQEEFRSYESNEALKKWFSSVIKYCATSEPGKETQILGTGTRKGLLDFYDFLITKMHYPVFRLPALKLLSGRFPEIDDITYHDDGQAVPDMSLGSYWHLGIPTHPLENLLVHRAEDIYDFSTNMQNEPISATGVYFRRKELHVIKWKPSEYTKYIIAVDPGFGLGKHADNSAIVCLANNPSMKDYYTIVDVFADKVPSIRQPLLDMYLKWGNVVKVVCEANYLQKIFAVDQLQDKLPFKLHPRYSRADKIMRIQSLKRPIAHRNLVLSDDCQGKELFLDEFLAFIPMKSSGSRKDDILDATQAAYETWVRRKGTKKGVSGKTSSKFKTY